jgi:hypothetical protein
MFVSDYQDIVEKMLQTWFKNFPESLLIAFGKLIDLEILTDLHVLTTLEYENLVSGMQSAYMCIDLYVNECAPW